MFLPSSVCCSYQQIGYQIGEDITRSLATDLCTMVTLLCVAGEGGDPHIMIHTDRRECNKCASKEDLEDHDDQGEKCLDSLDGHAQDTNEMLIAMKLTMDKALNNTGKVR